MMLADPQVDLPEPRRVIQIAVEGDGAGWSLFVLCDDGTIWLRHSYEPLDGDPAWLRITAPP